MKSLDDVQDPPRPGAAYSLARAAGGFVFISGRGAFDTVTGKVIGTTVGEQTEKTIANLATLLAAHGLDLTDVVKATVHLQNRDADFDEFDATYAKLMPRPYAIRTTVGSDLADILVEIDIIALCRPDG